MNKTIVTSILLLAAIACNVHGFQLISSRPQLSSMSMTALPTPSPQSWKKLVAALSIGLTVSSLPDFALAAGSDVIEEVPLLVKRSSDLTTYTDIARGFRLQRPFGFNEFDGAGGGYVKKFASLVDFDENVLVGSVPASADKTSITDFGSLQSIGEKLAKKRNGVVLASRARSTDGIVFYEFEFSSPLDAALPRTGSKTNRPTAQVELYELCVHKGKLWSVQATSNDKIFPKHESYLRAALASFLPKL